MLRQRSIHGLDKLSDRTIPDEEWERRPVHLLSAGAADRCSDKTGQGYSEPEVQVHRAYCLVGPIVMEWTRSRLGGPWSARKTNRVALVGGSYF
mgnify:FL=1